MEQQATHAKDAEVRQAFHDQAAYCSRLGSPFTALICETLAETLSNAEACGQGILNWPGDPSPLADNLPLRVAGGLHALARTGAAPALSAIYPPNALPSMTEMKEVLRPVLAEWQQEILAFLAHAPQTNEVGRSGVLIGGFLEIAKLTGLPLSLHELGSSGGLNLLPDRFRYRLGDRIWNDAAPGPLLEPEWKGPLPPLDAGLSIAGRRGCDINPLDIRSPAQRERLLAYLWPDQLERMARMEAALNVALPDFPTVDKADAAEWVETRIAEPVSGRAQVLFHSVVWNYLPEETRARVTRRMEQVGAQADAGSPLAWLRLELEERGAALTLSLWPGEKDRLLAHAHPHGLSVEWQCGKVDRGIPKSRL